MFCGVLSNFFESGIDNFWMHDVHISQNVKLCSANLHRYSRAVHFIANAESILMFLLATERCRCVQRSGFCSSRNSLPPKGKLQMGRKNTISRSAQTRKKSRAFVRITLSEFEIPFPLALPGGPVALFQILLLGVAQKLISFNIAVGEYTFR